MISKSKYLFPLLNYSGSMLNLLSNSLSDALTLMYTNIKLSSVAELEMKTWHQIYSYKGFKK